tara:strand:- start:557 stop:805 length:249 start_codon:yes stop_codon:yes gene_type:complete
MAYKQKGFSPFTIKEESAMKAGHKKSVPVPKKNETPAQIVARLQRKEKQGTITAAEKRKLNKLQSEMDRFYSSKKKDPFGDK